MDLLTYSLLHKQIVKGDKPFKTAVGVGKSKKQAAKASKSSNLVRAPLPSTQFAEVNTIYIDKSKTVAQVNAVIKTLGEEYPIVTMPDGVPYLYMVGMDKEVSLVLMYASLSALISQYPELSNSNVKPTDFILGAMTLDLNSGEGISTILFSSVNCIMPDIYDETKTMQLTAGWQENTPDTLTVPNIPQAPFLNKVGMSLPWAPLLKDIFYVLKEPEPETQLLDPTEVDRLYYYNKDGTLNFNKPAYPKISLDQLYDRTNKNVAIGSELDLTGSEGTPFTLDVTVLNKIYVNKLSDSGMRKIAAEAKKFYKTKQSIYWNSYSSIGILYPILAWGEPYDTNSPLDLDSFNGGLFIGWLKENGDVSASDDDFAIIFKGGSYPSCLYASKSFRDPFGEYSDYIECQQGWNRILTEDCLDFSWVVSEYPEYGILYSGLSNFVDQSLFDLFKNVFSQTAFIPKVEDSIVLKRLNYSADPVYPKTRYSDLILNDDLFLTTDKVTIPCENNAKVSQIYIDTSIDASIVKQQLVKLKPASGSVTEPIIILGTPDGYKAEWGLIVDFNDYGDYYVTYTDNRTTDTITLELFNSDTGWNPDFKNLFIKFNPELVVKMASRPEVPEIVKDWLYIKPAGRSDEIQLYNPATGEKIYPAQKETINNNKILLAVSSPEVFTANKEFTIKINDEQKDAFDKTFVDKLSWQIIFSQSGISCPITFNPTEAVVLGVNNLVNANTIARFSGLENPKIISATLKQDLSSNPETREIVVKISDFISSDTTTQWDASNTKKLNYVNGSLTSGGLWTDAVITGSTDFSKFATLQESLSCITPPGKTEPGIAVDNKAKMLYFNKYLTKDEVLAELKAKVAQTGPDSPSTLLSFMDSWLDPIDISLQYQLTDTDCKLFIRQFGAEIIIFDSADPNFWVNSEPYNVSSYVLSPYSELETLNYIISKEPFIPKRTNKAILYGYSKLDTLDTTIPLYPKTIKSQLFEDDAVTPLDIKSGKDGRGITTIEKTSTEGLVDTYTINYSDASTPTTFNVTNGKDFTPKADEILYEGKGEEGLINTSNTFTFAQLADCNTVVLDGIKLGDADNSTDLHVAFNPYLLKHSYKLKIMASGAKGWASDIIISYTGDDQPITWETVNELHASKDFKVTKITKHY